MKIVKEATTLDAVADADDQFELEVQYDITGGLKLYVHCNGATILRVGRIKHDALGMTNESMARVVMR